MFVPVSKPLLDESDAIAVATTVRRGDVSGLFGTELDQFQENFAKFCGAKYALATTSCYTALHLAMATLGIDKGDEVLVSTYTNISSVLPIVYLGAKPIFIDIEKDTWNIDPKLIEKKINSKTKAIVVVHIYGHPVDMDPIMKIAKKYKLLVVEDVAEALGATYKGKPLGSIGDAGCFSFLANKFITTGEGGMVVFNDKNYFDKAFLQRSLAFGKENRYMHEYFGFNFRMSNILAALGLSQLKKVNKIVDKKINLAKFYIKSFKDIKEFQLPVEKAYAKNVYWMFHIVLKGVLAGRKKELMSKLKEVGVDTREGFVPMNKQKILIKKGYGKNEDCPVANRISENSFYIPSGPNITKEEMDYVVKNIKQVVRSLK
jgi:perosamine synthetase